MDQFRSGAMSRVVAWILRIFRERQIILRSDAQIRYFTLSTRAQLITVGAWCLLAGWFGFATIAYYLQDEMLRTKNLAIQRSQDSYRQLLDQVSDYQLSIVSITRDLKETQSHLQRLFDQNEDLKQDLNSTESMLKYTQVERDRIIAGRQALNDQFSLLGRELRRMTSKNNALESHIGSLRGHLETLKAEKDEIAAERAALDGRLWRLNNELAESVAKREQLTETINSLKSDLRNVMLERSTIASENDSLRTRVTMLEARVSEAENDFRRQLEAIAERALTNIQAVEAVLERTGLDLEEIAPMPQGTIMGQGGPFIPYHPDLQGGRIAGDFDSPDLQVEVRLARWEQLREVFLSIPLVAPMQEYYFASGFGRRKDPFNGRWAMHAGLDLGGAMGEPIYAPAPGVVVRARTEAMYGRMIEIDHGNEITTRYAHLSKMHVQEGQKVKLGDKIGALGVSGRSTGPHLHYEIRFKDQPLNPRRFLRAGRYVFEKG